MTVTQLVTAAFRQAAACYPDLARTWITISHRVGPFLPTSLLVLSVQRIGELDMLLRSLEDAYSPPREGAEDADLFSCHYQLMLSELWIGAVYEIFRMLLDRKLASNSNELIALAHDLKLLRIPLEKYEIAADRKLSDPLLMQKRSRNNDGTESYTSTTYSKADPQRSHIMPTEISARGSAMWHVIDLKSDKSYWIERRALSERIVALWASDTAQRSNSADNV